MTKVNLDNMSLKELHEVMAKAGKQIETKRKDEIKRIRAEINQTIKDHGLKPEDIFPALATATKSGTIPAKYKNPDNPSETWSGRGRKPKWLEAQLKAGKEKDDFAI